MDKTIGERIEEERKRRGLTLEGVRAKTGDGISVNSLSSIENDRHVPRYTTLRKIARAFGMTVEELTEGTDLHPKADPLSGPDAQAWLRERAQEGRRLYVPADELVNAWADMDVFDLDAEGRTIETERDEISREIDAFVGGLRKAEDRKDPVTYLNALRRVLKKDLQRRYRKRRLAQIDAERALVASAGQKLRRADVRRIIESKNAPAGK